VIIPVPGLDKKAFAAQQFQLGRIQLLYQAAFVNLPMREVNTGYLPEDKAGEIKTVTHVRGRGLTGSSRISTIPAGSSPLAVHPVSIGWLVQEA
jgi:hypothetical protein